MDHRKLSTDARRRQVLLWSHWNQDRTRKRVHRKTHGKIGFREMTKMIVARWKALESHEYAFYKELAEIDLQRFKKEMKLSKTAKDAY